MQCLQLTRGDAPSTDVTVTLTGTFDSTGCYVDINGVTYSSNGTIRVERGASITAVVAKTIVSGSITMNGKSVGSEIGNKKTYTFVATENVSIEGDVGGNLMYSAKITMPA